MNYITCKDYIRSDYYRLKGRMADSILRMWVATILDTGFRFLFWMRLANCDSVLLGLMGRLAYTHLRLKHHIDIQRTTAIGYSFKINHGGPVVINASAVIGDNVEIGQNCTIGSIHFKAAHIGNNVYIGPSVCIVEDVTIGDGVTIGAGEVVVKDIPDGVTVAGNPAREISRKEPGRLVWKRWDRAWNKA